MIRGIGVDSIEIARVAAALARNPGLMKRLYTPEEIAQAPPGPKGSSRLAAVFAGKEAVFKALGTGLAGHSWRQVQILHQPGGAPRVQLRGRAAQTARDKGIERIHISLTHDQQRALAFCIAEG
ncbi:MAG: holo-ACP synthase [Firmicutes bacterium]|nr:holo-ACP synthase [Bacillota bacterium]